MVLMKQLRGATHKRPRNLNPIVSFIAEIIREN
jgi:hypothetical protein